MYFFREKKKNTLRYHFFTTVYQKSWWYDLQLVRYRVWQQIEIGNYGSLLTLLPPSPLFQKPKETRILKKCKKLPETSSFYTYVLKTTIQWGMVPEIRSETDRIFLPFWPILCIFTPTTKKNKKASGESIILHMCAKNHDHDVLFLRYKAQQTIFCHFGPYFALWPHY